jgi:hypothetical protein
MNAMKTRVQNDRPTDAVVQAVATVEGVEPVDLDVPLFSVVDPDALDRLFESPSDDLAVTFRYHGHDIELASDLTVAVDGTEIRPEH